MESTFTNARQLATAINKQFTNKYMKTEKQKSIGDEIVEQIERTASVFSVTMTECAGYKTAFLYDNTCDKLVIIQESSSDFKTIYIDYDEIESIKSVLP